jgi:hypothetical protein
MDQAKLPHNQMMTEIQALPKMVEAGLMDPEMARMIYSDRMARIAAARRHAEKQGYADGGEVDPIAAAYARAGIQRPADMAGKGYQAAPTPQQQAPAPAPVQQPQGLWGKMKGALGGTTSEGALQRRERAAGFAVGGPVNFGDDSQDGLNKRLAAAQADNMSGGGTSATGHLNDAGQNKLLNTALGRPDPNDFMSQFRSFMGDQGYGITGPTTTPPTKGVQGIGSSAGYGSFTNSMGKTFGEGGSAPIGSATAGRNMSDGYRNSQYGWANGGPVSVAGNIVRGPGGPKDDDIDTVIDVGTPQERPAALSSGEFVMPVEAVNYFGVKRLNDMVAKATKGVEYRKPANA